MFYWEKTKTPEVPFMTRCPEGHLYTYKKKGGDTGQKENGHWDREPDIVLPCMTRSPTGLNSVVSYPRGESQHI